MGLPRQICFLMICMILGACIPRPFTVLSSESVRMIPGVPDAPAFTEYRWLIRVKSPSDQLQFGPFLIEGKVYRAIPATDTLRFQAYPDFNTGDSLYFGMRSTNPAEDTSLRSTFPADLLKKKWVISYRTGKKTAFFSGDTFGAEKIRPMP